MNNEEMLNTYEIIAKIMNQMRESAKRDDWHRISQLELLCKKYSDKFPACKELRPLSQEAIERKIASLNIILKNDKEIREYLEPWQKKLSELMTNTQGIKSIL